jgi:hypothetical protein
LLIRVREGAFEFLRWKLRFAASCTRHLRGDISQRREMDFRSCFRGADAIRGRGRAGGGCDLALLAKLDGRVGTGERIASSSNMPFLSSSPDQGRREQ